MSFPTKEKPSNSVRNSARSPRRMAMQYSTKPAPSTIPSREVRMERKVDSRPESPARVSTMLRTRLRPKYRAAMARGETWASASRSFMSRFSCLRSISEAIIREVLQNNMSIHVSKHRFESSLSCFDERSNPIGQKGTPRLKTPGMGHVFREGIVSCSGTPWKSSKKLVKITTYFGKKPCSQYGHLLIFGVE